MIMLPQMKDLLFYSGRNSYGGILRTGFTVYEGFFSVLFIGPFPAVENLSRNPKKSARSSYVSDLLSIIENP
jgi:hypothetical protein